MSENDEVNEVHDPIYVGPVPVAGGISNTSNNSTPRSLSRASTHSDSDSATTTSKSTGTYLEQKILYLQS